jgi:hypothetical protein
MNFCQNQPNLHIYGKYWQNALCFSVRVRVVPIRISLIEGVAVNKEATEPRVPFG